MDDVGRERPEAVCRAPLHTVAWVDVTFRADTAPGTASSAVGTAVECIRQAVRIDDRICPLTTSRLAIEFGASAVGVPPQVLGERLARALDQDSVAGAVTTLVATSIGVASPGPDLTPADLTRRALVAARAGASLLAEHDGTTSPRRHATVTVDRLVARGPNTPDPRVTFQPIHVRSMRRLELETPRDSRRTLIPTSARLPDPGVAGGPSPIDLSVLVVDPMGGADGTPGLAAQAAVAAAERSRCRSVGLAVAPDDQPSTVGDRAIDLAVVTLDGGWKHTPPGWASGTWELPARVTASLCAAGVTVLAMSAGAGAGALASCVAQGAIPLSSPDHLPDALRSLAPPCGGAPLPGTDLDHSEKFRALVGLTASERRVLFHLTEGWSAQDMADELIVSLTTVRSHIRSVLRKLGVRSQLAAVALANSRDLRPACARPTP